MVVEQLMRKMLAAMVQHEQPGATKSVNDNNLSQYYVHLSFQDAQLQTDKPTRTSYRHNLAHNTISKVDHTISSSWLSSTTKSFAASAVVGVIKA